MIAFVRVENDKNMTHAAINNLGIIEDLPLKLNVEFTEDGFFEFCQINRELRIERDKNGTIHIMTPTGFETGRYNANVITDLNNWNRKNNTGVVGDSSTGYTLPNGAVRSPDASWVSNERLAALSKEQLQKFPPVCPDFVVEIRSPSDNLSKLKKKMGEYMENGCRLAWLIDLGNKQAFIYRADGSITVVHSFSQKLSGEEVLAGFEMELII